MPWSPSEPRLCRKRARWLEAALPIRVRQLGVCKQLGSSSRVFPAAGCALRFWTRGLTDGIRTFAAGGSLPNLSCQASPLTMSTDTEHTAQERHAVPSDRVLD